jgi:hypothetical protein
MTLAALPLRVKDGCGRQADGTAGVPSAPENSRCVPHLRFVPVAAIEDEGTILYSIVTCFLPDAPKSILVEEDTRGSEMLPEPIAYCFYHYRRLFFHTWIVTTFTIIMAAAPLQASVTPKASACGYLAGLIDKAPPGPLFLPSYPTVESGPLHGAAYLYDNAVAAIALVGCGEQDKAYRIGAAILWAIDNDRTWHDGRLRNAYAAGVVANGPVKLPGWWDDTHTASKTA